MKVPPGLVDVGLLLLVLEVAYDEARQVGDHGDGLLELEALHG